MKSDKLIIVFLVGFISFIIYLANIGGEFSMNSLVFYGVGFGVLAFISLIVGSLFKSTEMRGVVVFIYICIMGAAVQNAHEAQIRKERAREAQRIEWEKHQAWYNSLSEFERLRYDNERLREENAILSR